MLVNEQGPNNIFVKIRELTGIEHDEDHVPIVLPDNSVFKCLWCTSVWVAFAMLFVPKSIRLMLAGSAIACLIEDKRG